MEVALDVLREDRADLPVDEVEQIDEKQDGGDVPRIARCAIFKRRDVRCHGPQRRGVDREGAVRGAIAASYRASRHHRCRLHT